MSPKFMDAGDKEISSADKEKHDAGGLAGQVWNMVAEHPYASAAAVGAAALVGSRAGLGRAVAALGEKCLQPKPPQFESVEANIFGLLRRDNADLIRIAAEQRQLGGREFFKLSDTTMSLENPQRWKLLVEAAGRDEYNASVLREVNNWGTRADEALAKGVALNHNKILSLSTMDKPSEVSFATVQLTFLSHYKNSQYLKFFPTRPTLLSGHRALEWENCFPTRSTLVP